MPLGIENIGRIVAHRTRRGLYAGRRVLFGNRVSEDGGNRTRRKWLPNVHGKRILSNILDEMIPIRLTTGAMRNIDKAGGLDSYLKRIEGGKEDSPMAEALRQRIRREVEGRQLALEMAAQEAAKKERREKEMAAKVERLAALKAAREERARNLKLMPKGAAIVED